MALTAPQDTARLLAVVQDAQDKLAQLEATAKGLIDELATTGPAATPRLKELLALGDGLVAKVQAAGAELAPRLLPGAALPPPPDRAAVDAVWAHQLQAVREPALAPTPVGQPAASLQQLAATLQALPGCRLQLLRGRVPAAQASSATAVLFHCARAFAAVVHLQSPGGLVPMRVGLLSAAEAAEALAGGDAVGMDGGGGRSLWAPSQHAVFRQLSAHAAAAMEHFLQQQQQQQQQADAAGAASALEMFLLWLATCGDVFSPRPSGGGSGAGGLLLADAASTAGVGALSLRRPCRLSWEQLWAAALNPHLRTAEPVPVDGSC